MSNRAHVKSRIKVCRPLFHLQDKKADAELLTKEMILSAKRTGQLSLCGKGLGSIPEKVLKFDELELEDSQNVDFTKSGNDKWWTAEPLKSLDLSSNAITSIPACVQQLQSLVTFRLHDNALTRLPPEIGELKSLATLSLDRNKLSVLPREFYNLVELRWLSISHNRLHKIEPDFGDLVMLNFLDLSHNQLAVLPPGMGYLVRLVELNLAGNKLEELPPDIVNLRELKKLNVSDNKLKSLPTMSELRKLVVLVANRNQIEELPDFYGCTALKEIYIANNFITEITDDFCEQTQLLCILDIHENKLKKLPEKISLMRNLKRFDLANNNLKTLPKNMGLLNQLQNLTMDGNNLMFVRQDVIRGGTDRMLKFFRDRITEEVINETRFTKDEWPDTYTMKKSQALVLVSRELTTVPDSVFQAAKQADVHVVDLSKNKLTAVPKGIQVLQYNMSQLVLSTNSLTVLPPELCRCISLQFLDVSKNCLSDLPENLGELTAMRELVISNNKFTKIPQSAYDLANLEILVAADNCIAEIDTAPEALGKLRKLAVLDLRNNSIMTVPPALGTFTHLRSVDLMGNCFRQPRHAILERGTETLLSYLRDRIPNPK